MKKKCNLKFVIYAPPYNENVGGIIALHKLCDILNNYGEKAYIAKYYRNIPNIKENNLLKYFYRLLKWGFKRYVVPYNRCSLLNTPLIDIKEVDNSSVVIYPEIVSGNPLRAKNVVRWFLHKPGFHTGVINYGKNELYFFFQEVFNDPSINPDPTNLLTVLWVRDDIYKQFNYGARSGVCYMLRKGRNRKIVHDINNSILLDGKSQKEIVKIMNKCEFFISYDLYTMYSQYAVLCGCKSIVIPEEGITKLEWQPKKEFRYGVAYGFDDIEEAEKTKNLVYKVLKDEEKKSHLTVELFIKKVYNYFG